MLISLAFLCSDIIHNYFRPKFIMAKSLIDWLLIKINYTIVMAILLLGVLPALFDFLWIPSIGMNGKQSFRYCMTAWFLFIFIVLTLCCETDSNKYVDDVSRIFIHLPNNIQFGIDINKKHETG
jgi:hypothetical protein